VSLQGWQKKKRAAEGIDTEIEIEKKINELFDVTKS